jgi:hypothetical protein
MCNFGVQKLNETFQNKFYPTKIKYLVRSKKTVSFDNTIYTENKTNADNEQRWGGKQKIQLKITKIIFTNIILSRKSACGNPDSRLRSPRVPRNTV